MNGKRFTQTWCWEDGMLRHRSLYKSGKDYFSLFGGLIPVFDTGDWKLECRVNDKDYSLKLSVGDEVHTFSTQDMSTPSVRTASWGVVPMLVSYYFDEQHIHEEVVRYTDGLVVAYIDGANTVKYRNRVLTNRYSIIRVGSFLFLLSPDRRMKIRGVVLGEPSDMSSHLFDVDSILWAKDTELVRNHFLYHNEEVEV